jgi:single-strand DNA-binding protein
MQAFGMARVGRDTEVRNTPSGQSVANVSLAFSFGRKGDDGKRPTQWVDASLWGKRAESLGPYLTKGSLVVVSLDEVCIQNFTKADGTVASKLVGSITQIELAGGGNQQREAAPPPPPPPPKPAPRPPVSNGGFDDMDSDIPF